MFRSREGKVLGRKSMVSYGSTRLKLVAAMILGLVVISHAVIDPANALTIELKDVAADRVERQRAAATGALPLPGTPDVGVLQQRLKEKGVTLSSPILIRIFKAESELEVWKQKDDAFILFATYPICHWSGTLGPKLRDGDRQAPEGYYTVTRRRRGMWGDGRCRSISAFPTSSTSHRRGPGPTSSSMAGARRSAASR